jgi:CRISPR-associated protein Cmr6
MYPFSKDLQDLTNNFTNGNFGLWYNKFIPVSDNDYKASDKFGNTSKAIDYYKEQYSKIIMLDKLLKEKHMKQALFLKSFSENKFNKIIIVAKAISPLITGLGETHPHETSMVFERNIGVPYIPASSIKGIMRFTHSLDRYLDNKENIKTDNKYGSEYFDDEEDEIIRCAYGTQNWKGRVIFLDAYPLYKPELKIDVMTPHYVPYYTDTSGKTPPADYYNPVPLKFLTVKEETIFIFRILANKEKPDEKKICSIMKKALTEEGIGAKTAIGYGRFEITGCEEHDEVLKWIEKEKNEKEKHKKESAEKIKKEQEQQKFANMSEVEKAVYEINQTTDEKKLSECYKKLLNSNPDEQILIANALKGAYQRISKWDGKQSDKQKDKIKTIKNILDKAI